MTGGRSAGLVRRWVALYTAGLPADLRDARREEIEDDLWSAAHDDPAADAGGDVLGRLIFGIWADITWRLEQRQRGRVRPAWRDIPMGTRVVAALAIIGGATFALALTGVALLFKPDETIDSLDWAAPGVTTVLTVYTAAVVVLSIALWGLTGRFTDRIRGSVALAGSIGGFGGVLSALGAYALMVLLPVGSAAVAWDLSRLGALPRSVAILHILAAVAFDVVLVAALMNVHVSTLVVLVLVPYPLTWIGIGTVLLRGQAVADHPFV